MAVDPKPTAKLPKALQWSSWTKNIGRIGNGIKLGIPRTAQSVFERLIYLNGLSEHLAIKWLQRVYLGKFRLDWVLSKAPPHFYSHRMGMAQFTFGEAVLGPYTYFRGFFACQVIRDGDKLLDIGCGDGFFTKRFFSAKCSHVDGIDIEPSAIHCAERENGAENIRYHLLDAVGSDFPRRKYDVVVWDGAIGHFPPDALEIMLQKILDAVSPDGIFVGSESLGDEGADHLTRFYALDDFGKLFSRYFKYVEVSSQDYRLAGDFLRHEAYWRCANQPDRLQRLTWNQYYREG